MTKIEEINGLLEKAKGCLRCTPAIICDALIFVEQASEILKSILSEDKLKNSEDIKLVEMNTTWTNIQKISPE